MLSPTAAHFQTALRLLAHEDAGNGGPPATASRVYDALFNALAPVIGVDGVEALSDRSFKLLKRRFLPLADVSRAEPPEANKQAVRRLVEALSKLEPAVASEIAAGFFATFFGLICNFIGESLVWQIVQKAFPAIVETRGKGEGSMSSAVPIRRLASGVSGLDEVLGGGIPESSLNLIVGDSGSGKTTLGHQIMFANASPERQAIFFTVIGEPPRQFTGTPKKGRP